MARKARGLDVAVDVDYPFRPHAQLDSPWWPIKRMGGSVCGVTEQPHWFATVAVCHRLDPALLNPDGFCLAGSSSCPRLAGGLAWLLLETLLLQGVQPQDITQPKVVNRVSVVTRQGLHARLARQDGRSWPCWNSTPFIAEADQQPVVSVQRKGVMLTRSWLYRAPLLENHHLPTTEGAILLVSAAMRHQPGYWSGLCEDGVQLDCTCIQ